MLYEYSGKWDALTFGNLGTASGVLPENQKKCHFSTKNCQKISLKKRRGKENKTEW